MRVLLSLSPTKRFSYDLMYFHKAQGFVYGLLKATPYSALHDKKGYKFFCFSNIFPIGDFEIRDERYLIISSPSDQFIEILLKRLKEMINRDEYIHIGEMEFEISNIKTLKPRLDSNCRLISATPIIIRIPEKNYDKYGIPEELRKRRYVYWRKEYSFESFVKQLEENLIKKYNEFHKTDFEIDGIFEMYKFIKGPIINHIIIDGREQIMVGSLWEFLFSYLSKEQRKILEFGIDCGFGERNSFGFGFINVVK